MGRDAICNISSGEQVTGNMQKCCPTQRTPGVWHFQAFFWLRAFPTSQTLFTPAHTQVTQADGLLIIFNNGQVAAHAAVPQQVLVTWQNLANMVNPQGIVGWR